MLRICTAILLSLVLTACFTSKKRHQPRSDTGAQDEDPDPFPPAAEGEVCGTIAGILCKEGLECKLESNDPEQTDKAGICVKVIVPPVPVDVDGD